MKRIKFIGEVHPKLHDHWKQHFSMVKIMVMMMMMIITCFN